VLVANEMKKELKKALEPQAIPKLLDAPQLDQLTLDEIEALQVGVGRDSVTCVACVNGLSHMPRRYDGWDRGAAGGSGFLDNLSHITTLWPQSHLTWRLPC
jgi:hypothetical protein